MVSPVMRRYKLLQVLEKKRFHTIEELKGRVNTSHATIHRDLNLLEREGQIRKSYGCVEVLANNVAVREYDKRINLNIGLKEEIARKALEFVEKGNCIFLDSSSTGYYFGKVLVNSRIEELTIVTNSIHLISVFAEIESRVKLISTGGSFNRELNAFLGDTAIDFISRIMLDKIFISGAGFSFERGLTTTDDFLLGILRQALGIADKKYCLIDSSKFGKEYLLKISDLQDFDAVITNASIDTAEVKKARKAEVNLVLAKSGK